MNTLAAVQTLTLEPNDTRRLASLCGQFDENLHQIESRLNIEIRNRGNVFAFYGDATRARAALAREPQPEGIHGPPLKHLLGELKVFTSPLWNTRSLTEIPQAEHPRVVMLLAINLMSLTTSAFTLAVVALAYRQLGGGPGLQVVPPNVD